MGASRTRSSPHISQTRGRLIVAQVPNSRRRPYVVEAPPAVCPSTLSWRYARAEGLHQVTALVYKWLLRSRSTPGAPATVAQPALLPGVDIEYLLELCLAERPLRRGPQNSLEYLTLTRHVCADIYPLRRQSQFHSTIRVPKLSV